MKIQPDQKTTGVEKSSIIQSSGKGPSQIDIEQIAPQ